jgi:hypothetical protein
LKLEHEERLSNFAFKFNSRHYSVEVDEYVRFLASVLAAVAADYAGFELPPALAAEVRLPRASQPPPKGRAPDMSPATSTSGNSSRPLLSPT